jgi:hypothetical protein
VEYYLLFALFSVGMGLAYCVGSFFSPFTRTLKQQIRYLEGKQNQYKKEQKAVLREEKENGLEGLLPDDLGILKPLVSKFLDNPDNLAKIQGILGNLGSTPANPSDSNLNTWGK